jgi:hypothetical protein
MIVARWAASHGRFYRGEAVARRGSSYNLFNTIGMIIFAQNHNIIAIF